MDGGVVVHACRESNAIKDFEEFRVTWLKYHSLTTKSYKLSMVRNMFNHLMWMTNNILMSLSKDEDCQVVEGDGRRMW